MAGEKRSKNLPASKTHIQSFLYYLVKVYLFINNSICDKFLYRIVDSKYTSVCTLTNSVQNHLMSYSSSLNIEHGMRSNQRREEGTDMLLNKTGYSLQPYGIYS